MYINYLHVCLLYLILKSPVKKYLFNLSCANKYDGRACFGINKDL